MDDIKTLQQQIKTYRYRVQVAEDDVKNAQQQFTIQQQQLDSLISYQSECEQGFLSLPDNAFYYAQRRECKLLLNHIEGVIDEQQHRVENCYHYGEQCQQQWQQQSTILDDYETRLKTLTRHKESVAPIDEVTEKPIHKSQISYKTDKTIETDRYSWIHVGKEI